jgi:nitrogen fixation protein FixH
MKKGSAWPWLIAGALALHVVVSLVVVFIATSDPSYAVEKNYYQKAIDWDKKMAQDRTNQDLGWRFEFAVAPPERPGDQPRLEVTLADADGVPLTGATVTVEAFHNASSGDVLRATLPPTGESGVSRTTMPMGHNGRWELRFTIDHGGREFTSTETRHLFVEGNWK